jgi:hypothetical protein
MLPSLPHHSTCLDSIGLVASQIANRDCLPLSTMIPVSFSLARSAAEDEDVNIKRVTDCFDAALRAFNVPVIALGITLLGSELKETSDAFFFNRSMLGVYQDLSYLSRDSHTTWMKPETPLVASSNAPSCSIDDTMTDSNLPLPYLFSKKALSHGFGARTVPRTL